MMMMMMMMTMILMMRILMMMRMMMISMIMMMMMMMKWRLRRKRLNRNPLLLCHTLVPLRWRLTLIYVTFASRPLLSPLALLLRLLLLRMLRRLHKHRLLVCGVMRTRLL
jgi:hypothetical protein